MTSKNEKFKKSDKSKFAKDSSKKGKFGKVAEQSGNAVSKGSIELGCNKRDNDPSWYTAYPGIYSATSNISFNQPVGVGLDMDDVSGSVIANGSNMLNVPNVMSFDLIFTPGISDSAASVVNTAMFQNYNFVRHANSGSKNYDAVDLQMYYIAVNEALALLWEGIRAYGTLSTFSTLNRSLPRALFKGYGFDYDSWKNNPAQLRSRLNLAATKLGSLCVPSTSRLLARMQYLMSNVFMDGDNVKSQYYIFRMSHVHEWGRVAQVGTLQARKLDYDLPVDSYFDILDRVLQPLLEDEDINIMSGDVLKAYGSANLTPIPMVPDIYGTPIITSKENPFMMSQIENALWMPNLTNLDITQSTNGYIQFHPTAVVDVTSNYNALSTFKALLNSRNQEVTSEEVMELTRLIPVFDSQFDEAGTKVINTIRACGSEIITDVNIYSYVNGGIVKDNLRKCAINLGSVPNAYFNFDWAPFVYICATMQEGDRYKGKLAAVLGDLSNYTAISKHTLHLIHDTAIASEFLLDQPTSNRY